MFDVGSWALFYKTLLKKGINGRQKGEGEILQITPLLKSYVNWKVDWTARVVSSEELLDISLKLILILFIKNCNVSVNNVSSFLKKNEFKLKSKSKYT